MNYSYYSSPNSYVYYVPSVAPTTQSYIFPTVSHLNYQQSPSYRGAFMPPMPQMHSRPAVMREATGRPTRLGFFERIFTLNFNDKTANQTRPQAAPPKAAPQVVPKEMPSAPPKTSQQENVYTHTFVDPNRSQSRSSNEFSQKKSSSYDFLAKTNENKPLSSPKKVRFSKYNTVHNTSSHHEDEDDVISNERDDLRSNLYSRRSSSLNDIHSKSKVNSDESLDRKSSSTSIKQVRFDKYRTLGDTISQSKDTFSSEKDLRPLRDSWLSSQNSIRRSTSRNDDVSERLGRDYLGDDVYRRRMQADDVSANKPRKSRHYYENEEDYGDVYTEDQPYMHRSSSSSGQTKLPKQVISPHIINDKCPCCNQSTSRNHAANEEKNNDFMSDLINSFALFKTSLKQRINQRFKQNRSSNKTQFMRPV